MNRVYPVNFIWREVDVIDGDGEVRRQMAMVPSGNYASVIRRQFHAGEEYTLAPIEARSRASHNQYFAAVADGYQTLPEYDRRWRNAEHLRKWALVETGWFDELEIELQSPRHAERLTARLIEYAQQHRVYVKVIIEGSRVLIRTAQSQAAAAMGKVDFEQSKRDVLDLIEGFIDVPRGTLMREAGKHA
jgi:hypothetical protein